VNCDAFREIVVALARAEGDGGADQDAARHAAACARCAAVLDAQRGLSVGLRRLRDATADAEASAATAAVVLQALRRRAAEEGGRHSRSWPSTAWRLAAAVVLAVVGGVLWRAAMERTRSAPEVVRAPPAVASTPAPTGALRQATAERPTRPRTPPVARVRRPPRPPEATSQTVFLPLLPEGMLDERQPTRLVRVGLPRAALVSWGWPLEGDVAAETIEAEVLVGEDGMARAIRVAR
jgi:hypothetical protein